MNFQLIFSKKYIEVVGMARLTLDLSPEINERLEAIARSNGITKSEAMRRAFALLAVADTEKKKGLSNKCRDTNQPHYSQNLLSEV